MLDHYADVLQDLKISEDVYCIKPYMCMNKVFVSRYKEVSFPIVSYTELKKLIEGE